jgi:hypothetical protein
VLAIVVAFLPGPAAHIFTTDENIIRIFKKVAPYLVR